jgi:hypothetical protein
MAVSLHIAGVVQRVTVSARLAQPVYSSTADYIKAYYILTDYVTDNPPGSMADKACIGGSCSAVLWKLLPASVGGLVHMPCAFAAAAALEPWRSLLTANVVQPSQFH